MKRVSNVYESPKLVVIDKLPSVEYGLSGIMRIFRVSKSTAFKYRHTIIKDACVQQGNKIIVDVRKALLLFGVSDVDSMIEDKPEEEFSSVSLD